MLRLRLPRLAAIAAALAACQSATAPVPATVPPLVYDEGAAQRYPYRWSAPGEPYLADVRARYALEGIAAAGSGSSDLARVRAVSRWAHARFAHDGAHPSRYADPMGILAEAATGARFRCVEYAAVTSGALTALGIPSRMVWLLTRDEGTRSDGLAHVVAEAYLRDLGRWVLVDAQWDVVPMRDGVPLSAVELQRALAAHEPDVTVESASGTGTAGYLAWIAPYLHYFYTPLDGRVGVARDAGALLLTPVGDASLDRKYPPPTTIHTHSVGAFYPEPE